MKYYFVGIAGSGMSALAQLIRSAGHEVSGSDRSFDRQEQPDLRAALAGLGIKIFPQDGSGISEQIQEIVLSTAIETQNLDLARAVALKIPLMRRARLLAQIFDKNLGIAIAGTSGKSTVAAMTATALRKLGLDPTYYAGAALIEDGLLPCLANALAGNSKFFCAETDESDGSFLEFHPKIAVVTNISKDHKSDEELRDLFSRFMAQTQDTLILNADCPVTSTLPLPDKQILWYGTDATRFPLVIQNASVDATRIQWKGIPLTIRSPGLHNVSNALAALSVLETLEIPLADAAKALESYKGIRRRLELVAKVNGICVYDDYAHNPAKIEATLRTLQSFFPRVRAVFQLHGFGPARFMSKDLQELFARMLRPADQLILPKIYDAGGSADRSISAQDVVEGILSIRPKAQAFYTPENVQVVEALAAAAKPGDVIVVMGARDPGLPDLCKSIARSLDGGGKFEGHL